MPTDDAAPPERRGRTTLTELERLIRLRRKVNPDFVKALAADFKAHGAEAIAYARISRSSTYLKLAAILMPELSEEELLAMAAARDEALAKMRAARDGTEGDGRPGDETGGDGAAGAGGGSAGAPQ